LLLVGDGSYRPVIKDKIQQMGLTPYVIFAGLRSDVPRLMLGAMDIFILPSLYEGLPVVGIEAQAANLPFILSDVITEELDRVKPLIHRISLSQPASVWAETILSARNTVSNITEADSLAILEYSHFNIACSVDSLTKIYTDEYCKTYFSR
jgi:glycosyltransferase involved in cell wall biosynthesis